MISTRELARLAGVSQSTISRSLNDRPEISVDTKEKIRTLAKQHGFIVQRKAKKTLLTSKRKAIGVLLMSYHIFDDLFLKQLVSMLYGMIENENYYAMPLLDFRGAGGIQKIRDLFKLGLIEGFIIVNREYDAEMDRYLTEIGIPFVYLIFFGRNSSKQVNTVDTNNFLGGYLATQHLLDLGHKSIITISSYWGEFDDRTAGYRTALQERGIEFRQNYVLIGNCHYADGYELTRSNLALFSDATAIFGQCDLLAIGAMNALQDNGIKVPDDISVIGFDGMEIGNICRPELTSIAQPFEDLAKVAVEKLLDIVNTPGKKSVQAKTFLQPHLVIRESTRSIGDNESHIH
jgi:LacI family transcriptional regulator